MQYKIDYMKKLELKSTLNLVKNVFDECNSSDFEVEGINNFYNYISENDMKSKIDSGNMVFLVARTSYNQIIGTIAVSAENQVNLLFVDKKFQNKGIGTNLLKFAINLCKYNDEELEKITVNSTPFAVEFFIGQGFEELSEMQEVSGVKFLPMEKILVEKENKDQDEENEVEDEELENITEEIDDNEEKDEGDVFYNLLSEYYSEFDEDSRLKNSKKGNLEFITTTTYIQKYLCKKDRILEIGAGTGVYSKYYSNQGYKVDAVELLDVNLEKLKQNNNNNLKVHKANAIDLSGFDDDTFDITLCLGPMYHLFSEEDRKKAIEEAIRVTKPCGKIFFSYITNESVIINYFLRERHLIDRKDSHDEDFIVKNNPKEVFCVTTVKSFKEMMKDFNVKCLNNVATDGIAGIINDDLEYLDDEEFEEWINYHLATCERKDLIGFSSHVLYICEK